MKVLIKVPEDSDRSEALKIYDIIDKMGHNVTILFQGTEEEMDFSNNGYLPPKEDDANEREDVGTARRRFTSITAVRVQR